MQSKGAEMIVAERKRQVESEGWTPEHDAQHRRGELARAAAVYAVDGDVFIRETRHVLVSKGRGCADPDYYADKTGYFKLWPWESQWYKPKDRVSNLARAGALIAAEIDRLLALSPKEVEKR